jgi:isopentenyl phosphate kinase
MFLIKFGGSVITDKRNKNTFEYERTASLVSEIKEAGKRTVIVHGAGSFGHILAKKHRLYMGYKDQEQIKALAEVQKDVKNLNMMVLSSFREQGLSAVSLAPSAFLVNENGEIKSMDSTLFLKYFDLGFIPITFGDVVIDNKLKFSICSGDQLMLELAKVFKPEKVIFVADVDGIFPSDPATGGNPVLLPVMDEATFSSLKKGESEVDDVTGSIYGKLEIMFKIAAMGHEAVILNGNVENRLKDTLLNREVTCTRIMGKN